MHLFLKLQSEIFDGLFQMIAYKNTDFSELYKKVIISEQLSEEANERFQAKINRLLFYMVQHEETCGPDLFYLRQNIENFSKTCPAIEPIEKLQMEINQGLFNVLHDEADSDINLEEKIQQFKSMVNTILSKTHLGKVNTIEMSEVSQDREGLRFK